MDKHELLSAYISGDVTPQERADIEKLLAADPALQEEACRLKEFLPSLKAGELPVKAPVLQELRRRVEQGVAEKVGVEQTEMLISASLSNDVDSREKEILAKHLEKNSKAARQLQSLKKLDELLKKHPLPVKEELSQKLADRLNAKLPPRARVALKPTASSTSAAMPRVSQPSLRVYAPPENIWGKRLVVIGVGAAALFAITFGVSRFFVAKPANNVVRVTPGIDTKQNVVAPKESTNGESQIVEKIPDVVPAPQLPNEVRDELTHKERERKTPPVPAPLPNVADFANKEPKLQPSSLPQHAAPLPENRDVATPQNSIVPDSKLPTPSITRNDAPGITPPTISVPENGNIISNNSGGGAIALAPNNGQPQNTPDQTQTDTNVAASTSGALVSTVTGAASWTSPAGATNTVRAREYIPSGSTITAEQSQVALTLPGSSKLYINSGSRVKLTLRGSVAEVTLDKGEIDFRSSGAGSLLLKAGNVSVAKAKSLDAVIEGNQLVVSNLDTPASVTAKGKGHTLQANSKMSVALNGSEAPEKTVAIQGRPDNWTMFDTGKETTSEKPNTPAPENKGRARTRKAR